MSDLYVRLRALCCQTWGIPPWEFDRAADREEIGLDDVFEVFVLRSFEPILGENIHRYVFREEVARQEKAKRNKVQKLGWLALLARSATDPKRKEELLAEIRKIQAEDSHGSRDRTQV